MPSVPALPSLHEGFWGGALGAAVPTRGLRAPFVGWVPPGRVGATQGGSEGFCSVPLAWPRCLQPTLLHVANRWDHCSGRETERKKKNKNHQKTRRREKRKGRPAGGTPRLSPGGFPARSPPAQPSGGLGAPPPLAHPQVRSGMEATARPEPEPERSAGSVQLGKEIIIIMVLINKEKEKRRSPAPDCQAGER